MFYAHVTNGTVDATGFPPDTLFSNGRWWDLRTLDLTTLAAVGWFPVTETARPADTSTTTWQEQFTPGVGDVDQSWVEVPKSAAQLQREQEAANRGATVANLTNDLVVMEAIRAQTNADLRNDPSQEIKDIARSMKRLIRVAINLNSVSE